MRKNNKSFGARQFSRVLLATLIVGFWLLESHAAVTVGYTFSDGDATTATNSGNLGVGLNGVITGGSIIASPFSADNQALQFNGGINAGIILPNMFGYGGAFTVETLAKLDSLNSTKDSIIFDDYGAPGVLLSVIRSDQTLRATVSTEDDGNVTVLSSSSFDLATWHHVATVYDGSFIRLYLDGILVAEQTATGLVDKIDAVDNAGFTPRIGLESGGVDFNWVGAIDDFRIHDQALMVSEFNGGDPLPAVPLPAAAWMLGSGLIGLIGLTRRKIR